MNRPHAALPPPQDVAEYARRAVAASWAPPRAGEALNFLKPLWDSDGFEHALVALADRQFVTQIRGIFVVWDRRTLTTMAEDTAADGGQLKLGNEPMAPGERERRRALGASLLLQLREQAQAAEKSFEGARWLAQLDDWTSEDSRDAAIEGWGLFHSGDGSDLHVERIDEPGTPEEPEVCPFATDDDAQTFVYGLGGSTPLHLKARRLIEQAATRRHENRHCQQEDAAEGASPRG